MRILVINPNSTASMTARIAAAARAAAAPGTEIEAANPSDGPVSIEGRYDEAFAVPGLLRLVRAGERRGIDGYVIACADDIGLAAAREIARGPVVGHTEAAALLAGRIAGGFSIVTTLSRSLPVFHELMQRYGTAPLCRSVRASDIPVLELENPASDARARLSREIELAVREDGAEAILLGCAGMVDLAAELSADFGLPVIDGVSAAVKLVEALVGLGLATAKAGALAWPRVKDYKGAFADDAPTTAG
ncbi:allantoin racemase [Tistlia consotensis]|uniref:Hydantoin racemase n=1 Tax=Tistlia consotensis USBA 355 TaxID=560819 RepID=A0A1Y6CK76_9PROT|nr:aspartate/glutamate racemase family protein [Tistlia consotensis]SMF68837.1 allantoin racemase [Tistlia consotensis USBA 355]SNS01455.1 allantoin racemase [Tistlia consotensis]